MDKTLLKPRYSCNIEKDFDLIYISKLERLNLDIYLKKIERSLRYADKTFFDTNIYQMLTIGAFRHLLNKNDSEETISKLLNKCHNYASSINEFVNNNNVYSSFSVIIELSSLSVLVNKSLECYSEIIPNKRIMGLLKEKFRDLSAINKSNAEILIKRLSSLKEKNKRLNENLYDLFFDAKGSNVDKELVNVFLNESLHGRCLMISRDKDVKSLVDLVIDDDYSLKKKLVISEKQLDFLTKTFSFLSYPSSHDKQLMNEIPYIN